MTWPSLWNHGNCCVVFSKGDDSHINGLISAKMTAKLQCMIYRQFRQSCTNEAYWSVHCDIMNILMRSFEVVVYRVTTSVLTEKSRVSPTMNSFWCSVIGQQGYEDLLCRIAKNIIFRIFSPQWYCHDIWREIAIVIHSNTYAVHQRFSTGSHSCPQWRVDMQPIPLPRFKTYQPLFVTFGSVY